MKIFLKIAFVFIFLFQGVSIYAQKQEKSDSHLTGHVTDKDTDEHIPYATIAIKGTAIGVTADATGHFLLKHLPIGKHTVVVSFYGYNTIEKEIEIVGHKTIEEKFVLQPKTILVDEIVVTGSRNESKKRESTSIVNVTSSKQLDRKSVV